jgi:hypothetical protein
MKKLLTVFLSVALVALVHVQSNAQNSHKLTAKRPLQAPP